MIFVNQMEKSDTMSIAHSQYVNWEFFKNKTILVTGGTGLIGKQIITAFLYANENLNTNIKILALVRNKKKAQTIFYGFKNIKFIVQDITKPIKYSKKVDYIIHTANTTSSKEMTERPVETINSIVEGTRNVLEFAKNKDVKSIVYLSSMEIYGDIPITREEPLSEEDYGYINILKTRSSYPEGKRLAEAMCASYAKEYKVPVKIARLAQTIGAGVDYNDGRVFAEFARCVVEKRDIVLKTKGETIRSYIYITDAITAILSMLEKGENGESYNVANPDTTCSIKEMAEMLCKKYNDIQLRFELNSDISHYLNTLKYFLDTRKLENTTGWKAEISLENSFGNLISSFCKNIRKEELGIKPYHLTPLQKIFSITNNNGNKILTILGLTLSADVQIFNSLYLHIYQMFHGIKKNKIILSNYMGLGYGCNCKYITEEVLKRKLPLDIVWLVLPETNTSQFPSNIRFVKYNTLNALKELVTAKIWCNNYHQVYFIKKGLIKNKKQKYIQNWHGSLGIKKIENAVSLLTNQQQWKNSAIKNSQMTDYWISNSDFETDVYKTSFWDVKNVKLFGHPRNDIFFKETTIKEKIYKYFNIPIDKKIALYVPTFRENEGFDFYNIDYKNVIKTLSERTCKDWCFITRLHPRVKRYTKYIIPSSTDIYDATDYPDIQELLVSADIAITDYSSCIFDFMLSRKPGFIFATDIDEYNTERGFYYPLESTPFSVAKTNEELCQNIMNFDNEKYVQEVEQFLKEKGCMEDGHASERVVDLIEKIIK